MVLWVSQKNPLSIDAPIVGKMALRTTIETLIATTIVETVAAMIRKRRETPRGTHGKVATYL